MNSLIKSIIKMMALILCLGISFSALAQMQWLDPIAIDDLNTSSRDIKPWITADGKTMYFSSDRPYLDHSKHDLFVSHLVDGVWSEPERLPSPPNMDGYLDAKPSLTLDGRFLYFLSNRPGGLGDWDIWVSENIQGVWQEPMNLGPNVNSAEQEDRVIINADGKILYFDSKRPGGYGDRDIWVSYKVDGVWQTAENFGPVINTPKAEDNMAVSYSGRLMFFAGHYPDSYGKADIYVSERISGVWQEPVNLGPVINTSSDDGPSYFNECDATLLIQILHGAYNWNIYETQWLNYPYKNACDYLIIPEGQWMVRVMLLEASAVLSNDVYIDEPIQELLVENSLRNVGAVVETPFISAEELIFHIHVDATSMGLGEYDHYSDSIFAQVERTDPLRYIVGFEDLPEDQADWDYNDTVLLIELIGEEVNIWEEENYLGEQQTVVETPIHQITDLVLNLSRGDASQATAAIPGGGLNESTYGVLIEGDPELYQELLEEAPFDTTDVFLKIELENGQAVMMSGEKIQISIDLDSNKMRDGASATALSLYRLDTDSLSWQELDEKSMPTDQRIEAKTTGIGLFALGYPKEEAQLVYDYDDGEYQPTSDKTTDGFNDYTDLPSFGCSQLASSGIGTISALVAGLVFIIPLIGLGILKISRRIRRR
jgi:hypothetical protein